MKYKNIFLPLKVGQVEVKNRLVVPALSTDYADEGGYVTDRLIDYYAARAEGGFGMVIIEASAIDPSGKALDREVGIWDDSFIPGLTRLADGIHKGGAKAFLQLHHCGRQTTEEINGGYPVVAPARVPCPVRRQMPHALTTAETEKIIEQFGRAALRARKAGFDGVELNAAHGYIIAQYMSLYVNKRTDRYGGNFECRMRFPTEIIKCIRRLTGSDFPIIFRLSGDEAVTAGRSVIESTAVARRMCDEGVDCISVSGGVYASIDNMTATGRTAPGHNVSAAEQIKKAVDVPVIVSGRINSPDLADAIIETGKTDFVAIGRGSLADPEFPKKACSGEADEILPCVGCLQGCIGYLLEQHKPISCLVNPFAGEEKTMQILPAETVKKIAIVGGGPAGLYAAWVLAKRGHEVKLYEKSEEFGGQLRLGAVPTGKAEIMCALRNFVAMGEKYGVEFHKGTEYSQECLSKDNPDVVILATGGKALRPPIPGIDLPFVVEANKVLAGEIFPQGKILVLGGGMVGCETAEFLADYGADLTIMEMKSGVAGDAPGLQKAALMNSLAEHNVKILTGAKAKEIYDGGISYESMVSDYGAGGVSVRRIEKLDNIILALGVRSNNPLEEAFAGKVKELYVIGDAKKGGKAIDHIYEAAKLAIVI